MNPDIRAQLFGKLNDFTSKQQTAMQQLMKTNEVNLYMPVLDRANETATWVRNHSLTEVSMETDHSYQIDLPSQVNLPSQVKPPSPSTAVEQNLPDPETFRLPTNPTLRKEKINILNPNYRIKNNCLQQSMQRKQENRHKNISKKVKRRT
jgi:hypothetical protein